MLRRDETLAAPVLPAPRFAAGWAALTYALCTLVLAYPVFSGQFLVNPDSDQYIAGYAFRLFGAQSLRTGHGFPLWNPYIMGGLPYVAAMHGDIFYPTFLLRMLMPTDLAMSWGFIIHLFLAGCFTYGFLRAWGFGFFPSLFGGVGYMLAGQVASLASPGHDGKLFVSALLPLALWMLLLGIRDGRQWAWGGLAAVIGLAVLSPHPQMLQYMLLGSGAFALFVAFSDHEGRGRLPRDVALRRLAYALGAVVLGLVVGAVQFLPVKEYVPWSPRAGGRGGYDFATQFSMPIEEFFNTYLPQFTGMLDHYWGRNQIHLHSEYLGVSMPDPRGRGVRRHRAARVPRLLALRPGGERALGHGGDHALLPPGVRDRARQQVLPRAEHHLLHDQLRDGHAGHGGDRARHSRGASACGTSPAGSFSERDRAPGQRRHAHQRGADHRGQLRRHAALRARAGQQWRTHSRGVAFVSRASGSRAALLFAVRREHGSRFARPPSRSSSSSQLIC